jgi:hypothetical protein
MLSPWIIAIVWFVFSNFETTHLILPDSQNHLKYLPAQIRKGFEDDFIILNSFLKIINT